MTTFARIVPGPDGFDQAMDIQTADSPAELAKRFHPDWFARNPFSAVPDGTTHGAVRNGGVFENRPPQNPEPVSAPGLTELEKLSATLSAVATKLGVDAATAIDAATAEKNK